MPRLFSSPWFGIVAGFASMISVPLAIYFYLAGEIEPELAFYPHPVRAEIVKKTEASDLTVSFKGVPISSPVTVA